MKMVLMTVALLISATVSAQAGTKYCQDVGSGELTIKGDKIEITTNGLGESDGTLSFQKMVKSDLDAQWLGNYSDYLKVPVASGVVYNGKFVRGSFKADAAVYLLNTEKDKLGRVQQVLMLALAGSPPSMIGVDVNCK